MKLVQSLRYRGSRILTVCLLALCAMAGLPAQAALDDLVTIGADTVTFDVTAIGSLLTTAVAGVIVAGLVLAIGIFGAKFIWRIFKGFLGRA